MKSGRLSFTVNGAGERRIDAAELERVFPATAASNSESNTTHAAVLSAQLEAERRRNAQLESTNDDLRARLDASEAERRNVQAQLTALLTAPTADQPSPLGRRILGWLARQHGW